ncbi:ferritin-like protein [Dickeya dadantii]|nr:ferritin-like protein [Dickeya dadantii]
MACKEPNMSLETQKTELLDWLKTAMTLEFGTIPPYMMALVSLHPDKNRVPANLIRAVMIEEMLHMTLVGNLINSLGGRVDLGPDSLPSYPLAMEFRGKRFKDRKFDVNLQAFSPQAIEIFMMIELPSDWAEREPLMLMAADELDIDGLTIGDFYLNILHQLEELCGKYGESAVFCGDLALQISQDYYWSSGGKPIVITNLSSAREAINTIIEQGEGSSTSIYDDDHRTFGQPMELAHFYRFREIYFARYYQPGDKPHQPPSGEAFPVDYQAVYPIKANPIAGDYVPDTPLAALNEQFNRQYTLMLLQLQQAFSGQPRALYTAIMNGMHGMVPIAVNMASQPIPGDAEQRHGTPTFSWFTP